MDGRDPEVNEEHLWYLFKKEHSHWYKKVEIPKVAEPKPVVMGPQNYHEEAKLRAKRARNLQKCAIALELSKDKTFIFGEL